jgi:hypothetical protein
MKVITAIEEYTPNPNDVKIFMAGGITKCKDWQKDIIEDLTCLSNIEKMSRSPLLKDVWNRLVLFNPRRENFPIHDPNASLDQIKWEFKWLEECDFFLMHFCDSESVQPICMYELGRNLVRMQQKFPNDYLHRIMICIEPGYSREQDVVIQTELAFPDPSYAYQIIYKQSGYDRKMDGLISKLRYFMK